MKRILTSLLALLMLTACFTGCGDKKDTSAPENNEPSKTETQAPAKKKSEPKITYDDFKAELDDFKYNVIRQKSFTATKEEDGLFEKVIKINGTLDEKNRITDLVVTVDNAGLRFDYFETITFDELLAFYNDSDHTPLYKIEAINVFMILASIEMLLDDDQNAKAVDIGRYTMKAMNSETEFAGWSYTIDVDKSNSRITANYKFIG